MAVNEDRIMALGSIFRDGDIGLRAYALGLAPDGFALNPEFTQIQLLRAKVR